jgi:hypothetical protein
MPKKYFFIVIIFNLIIASAFFIDNSHDSITKISGDLANIVPICKKLDNPSLFSKDMYLGEINNIKYYTPFYVQILRFIASFTNHDYLKALNVLSFFTHFFYGTIWFYLFYVIKKDFWLAFGFSIFFRGLIWPPGMELLGIADIWTIMPRTIFITLIPLPFIIFKSFNNLFLSAIVLGILVNFHPISGIGAIIIYLSLLLFNFYFTNQLFQKHKIILFIKILIGVFLGMTPYFLIYLTNVKPNVEINQLMFETAIHARMHEMFFDGIVFLKYWNKPFVYFFGSFFILFYFLDKSKIKINFKIIFFSIAVILILTNSLPFFEKIINNSFNLHFRIAFQLIRCQKLTIILLQVAMFLFLYEVIQKYNIQNKIKISIIGIYLMLLSLSTSTFLSKLPFIGEDISRFILPNNLKIYQSPKETNESILKVFNYVNKNTNINDLFYCKNFYFRSATSRSVAIDFHAAGMLIEGNPQAYINAYSDYMKYENSNFSQKLELLKFKKVNYIIDDQKWNNLVPTAIINEYFIYKLNY